MAPASASPRPASANGAAAFADAFAGEVEDRLRRLIAHERRRCAELGPAREEVLGALERAALAGGKRVRSKLMYVAFVGAGGRPGEAQAVDAGAALELLHTGCLVHDDIMDASPLRRGLPTVHAAFEALHRGAGWCGDASQFGASTAILVGDLAFYHAMALMTAAPRDAQRIFCEVGIDAGMGQYLDLRAAAEPATGEDAQLVARYKTARYTVEGPLQLGAALAGRLDDLAAPLAEYGRPLGEAYQLRDDLLGAFGDPAVTGKPVGDDLRQGKHTVLLAAARERVDELPDPRARALLRRVGRDELDEPEVRELQAVLVATGARERVAQECDARVRDALEALDRVDVSPQARVVLRGFALKFAQGAAEAAVAAS
ncbi:MAG TPA: polyprenyl synthetase family protein [Solirubrobacteraceae bacterium]|nr:polyprenyl synthetase family protein [Solirubrobacteraceae bacterium]